MCYTLGDGDVFYDGTKWVSSLFTPEQVASHLIKEHGIFDAERVVIEGTDEADM